MQVAKLILTEGNWKLYSYLRTRPNTNEPNGYQTIVKNEVIGKCVYPIFYSDKSVAYDFPEYLPKRLKERLQRKVKRENLYSWAKNEDLTIPYRDEEFDCLLVAEGIRKALKKGLIESKSYTKTKCVNGKRKIVGGCAQFLALVGHKGVTPNEADNLLVSATEGSDYEKAFAKLLGVPVILMKNVNHLHCADEIPARDIVWMLKTGKVPTDTLL